MAQRKSKNEKIAVLGYGAQGRAIALNFADSGYDVVVGLPSKSKSRKYAKIDKLTATTTSKAVKDSDIICFALPDHLQGKIYKNEIENQLKPGATLLFLHGFAINFKAIVPVKELDVIMIAPHAPGVAVRDKYLQKESISAFTAVYQDFSGKAKTTNIKLAKALGIKKEKLVATSFKDEAIGDLFGEQAVLCGGLSELILNGYEVLTENGINPDNAYLEVAYQLDLIISLIKEYGIHGMYDKISVAARYGSIKNGNKIIGPSVKKSMDKVFQEISSGKFAIELQNLNEKDIQLLSKRIKNRTPAQFEKAVKKFNKKR